MIGSQEPRIKLEPEIVTSDGGDAAQLMAAYGNTLDEWQRKIVDCWLGRDASGQYTVYSAGLSVPRQNGKNVCLEAREFYGAVVNGERILHTAHQVKTGKKAFRRLVSMFTDKRHPEIMDLVKHISYVNGEERIELSNGASVEFATRSKQSARGFDAISVVVYDEAQELTDEQQEAITATLSASNTGTRQIIYTGTPPYPTCQGTVFKRFRQNCLRDRGKHSAWYEWSPEGESLDDIKTGNHKLWFLTNPALGIRLTEEFTEEEYKSLSPDGFARERLGWWAPEEKHTEDMALDAEAWEKCVSDELKPEGKTAYGIKFSADATEVVLCGAVIPKDGKARISLINRQPTAIGIQWLADWLNVRYTKASCVVIDGRNGVDVLCDKISKTWRYKGSVIRPRVNDVIASVGLLTNMVNEGTLTWYRKQEGLNQSAITSIKRKIGSGYGFGGMDSLPIEACSLALWGATNSKRDPGRKMRIG
ncbi:MAG: terminase large subunit [Lachnospiraceae bacterium]|nr:terminase large subunit [Lachnospiraceae bacterium]